MFDLVGLVQLLATVAKAADANPTIHADLQHVVDEFKTKAEGVLAYHAAASTSPIDSDPTE